MPRIPMTEKAGMIRHVSDTVHMTGAPGLNWKLNEGQALIDMGDRLGRGAERLGNAMMAFGEHMRRQEDMLAATEDRNLFHKLNGELYNKLANTPGASDEEKQDWITGYRQMYEDGRKPFLEKMSGSFRKQHEAEMNGLRIHAENDRTRLLMQGAVQRMTDLTLGQMKEAALRGDEGEYRRILDGAMQGEYPLFSAETKEKLERDYQRIASGAEAKRRIASGERDMAEVLEERDGEGNYANYAAMDEGYRHKLIKYAKTEEAKRTAAEYEDLVNRLQSGEEITEEDIKKSFEGIPETAGSKERMKGQLEIVRKFRESQAKERERQAKEKERNAEAQKKKILDAVEYELMQYEFSPDAVEREEQYAEQRGKIFRNFANDGPAVKRLLTQLDETYKASAKPDESYKGAFGYKAASEYLSSKIKPKDFRTYAKAGDWSRTTNEATEAASYIRMKVSLDEFYRLNPGASFEDGKKFIDEAVNYISQQQVSDLTAAWDQVWKTAKKR